MSNFKNLLNDVLIEKHKSFKDLEDAGIISKRTFYHYKNYTPYLPTIIDIANYLKVSIDYLFNRTTSNNFKRYKKEQNTFYNKLMHVIKIANSSQSDVARNIKIGRPNFTYWKNGSLPKLTTLIDLANYFNCSIDDFLELE